RRPAAGRSFWSFSWIFFPHTIKNIVVFLKQQRYYTRFYGRIKVPIHEKCDFFAQNRKNGD
uniref:hypothetical protein n=1 Tax=Gemmiger formicilis TaxID=745368 RepID=UPI0040255AFC